jgi:chitodextrinase
MRLPRPSLALATAAALVAVAAPVASAHASGGRSAVDGTLRAWHGDTFRQPVDVGLGVDTTVDGVVHLTGTHGDHGRLLGHKVHAEGTREGQTLALSGNVTATGSTAVAAVTGTKTVGVLLFNFANDASQPWITSAVRSVVFDSTSSVAAYYRDASYGAVALTGDVFGWYTIDATNAGCDWSTWASQARAKAQSAGVALGGYQYLVYAFPYTSSCGWAGLGYLPGSGSWINGSMTLRVVGHELGHNLGVHHASTLACSSGGVPSVVTGTCSANEYGDPFTIMGQAATRLHNNWHRAQLGWAVGTQTVTTAGVYSLRSAELTGSLPGLLRVPRGDGTFLNLELRQPFGSFDGFATSDPAVTGVSVRIAPDVGTIVQSKLVDANPETSTFADAPFGAGTTLSDPVSKATITVVSVSPAGASVSIQFAPDGLAPTTPPSLTAGPLSASSVALSWGASTDDVGVAGYRITRNGAQIGTTTARTWTDTGLTGSTLYTYGVVAFDAAGNASAPATASATTPAADTQKPSAPGTLVARITRAHKVDLSWGAATDNVGVTGYRILRGGVVVKTVTALTYRDGPGRGTWTYTVVALDAAGNVGPASNAVTVNTG